MSAAVIMIASEILRIFLIILTSYAGAHPRDVSTYRGSAVFIFANAKTVREYVVQAAAKLLCGITVCYHKRFPSFLSIVGDTCMRGKGEAEETGDGSVSPSPVSSQRPRAMAKKRADHGSGYAAFKQHNSPGSARLRSYHLSGTGSSHSSTTRTVSITWSS